MVTRKRTAKGNEAYWATAMAVAQLTIVVHTRREKLIELMGSEGYGAWERSREVTDEQAAAALDALEPSCAS